VAGAAGGRARADPRRQRESFWRSFGAERGGEARVARREGVRAEDARDAGEDARAGREGAWVYG